MFDTIIQNLVNIGWAMLIFLAAYLANVTFSLWYNIKLQNQPFDRAKLAASGIKIATFVIGLIRPVSYTHLDVYKRHGRT